MAGQSSRKKSRSAGIKGISDEIRAEVEAAVALFNQEIFGNIDIFYQVRFQGKYCYLYRSDYGSLGPICRLTYTGDMKNWEFAIFKWSSESYDPHEWMFPGSDQVDGTVKGAMKAGLSAYPA